MPAYQYKCPKCGWDKLDMRTVEERHDGPTCHRCNVKMDLQVSAVVGIVRNPAVPRKT